MTDESTEAGAPSDFIRDIVAAHVAEGRYPEIVTRFPPEPNGYLHIGHTKAICLNAGLALENNGRFHLRMDDTNPAREDVEYVESILADVRWLIRGWADQRLAFKRRGRPPERREHDGRVDYVMPPVMPAPEGEADLEPFFASDYFEPLHEFALELIRRGRAYVCDLSPAETEAYRGAPDRPGRESPFRGRGVAENLELFARMRAGAFPDGARTLRAKIDMASPNINMRDPLLYRIRHTAHHQTGDAWCIYPMYDFAHCLSDYIEGVTHSICTLEFEVHRPLYDWILESLDLPRPLPRQYEFAKLIPSHTIVSKRRLSALVESGVVSGWDDPRLSTVSGIRRRGVPAAAVRRFAIGVGVTKFKSLTDIAVYEHVVRDELNALATRRLAVLDPVKLVLTNIPEGVTLEVEATNDPQAETPTTRTVPLGREVFIERDDFAETPPPKFHRLKPGGEVRLKYACIIRCDEVVKDASGALVEIRCTADLDSRTGGPNAARKVKGTIHWVSAAHAIDAEVRLYDRLFTVAEPDADGDPAAHLNPRSLVVVRGRLEPALAGAMVEDRFQFERLGYFALDPKDSSPAALVFNRTISLRDAR